MPLLLAVTGPCHGGLAPLLGLADHVVFTEGASAYINGPAAVEALTGLHLTSDALGGPSVHARATGLASLLATDENDAVDALVELLSHLPDNWLAETPVEACTDPADRSSEVAAALVPADPRAAYDVRELLADVLDRDSLLEVHGQHATNLVTAYGRLGGRAVAIVANQPLVPGGHARHRARRARRPATCRRPTAPTCRSSRSSTPPGSSRARTSSGGG